MPLHRRWETTRILRSMDQVDVVASRVSLCAAAGVVGGVIYATYAGFPLRSVAIRAGVSSAIVGTVLFGAERLAYNAMKDQINGERRKVLTSHAFSGVLGGGLNGYLYQKKPLRGMFVFIPVMLGIGGLELLWEDTKQARRDQMRKENEDLMERGTQ